MQPRTTQQNSIGNSLPRYHFNNYCHSGHADWSNCRKCSLNLGRRYVSLRRDGRTRYGGKTPIRLLFLGESPERTDSFTGRPFTGVYGRLINTLLEQSQCSIDYCMTNLVCCETKDIVKLLGPDGKEIYCSEQDEAESAIELFGASIEAINYNRPPSRAEATSCSNHIDELISTFKPRGIVYLGILPMAYYRCSLPYLCLFKPSMFVFMKQEYKLLPLKHEARKLSAFVKELSPCTL